MTDKKTATKAPAKKPAAKKPAVKKSVLPPPTKTKPLKFPEVTMAEMLAWIAVKGQIPPAVPDWAGPQFEKLHEFLDAIGNSGLDVPAADQCFSDWLANEKVSPDDFRYHDNDEDEDD